MSIVHFLARTFIALFLAASVGVAAVAACAGEAQTIHAKMACCKAMGKACEKRTAVADCCATDQDAHQTAGIAAAVASNRLSLHAASAATTVAVVGGPDTPIVHLASRTELPDRHRPHSPPHLRHTALLI
jgi:hypothetical protein